MSAYGLGNAGVRTNKAAAGGATAANNGVSLNGSTVELGQAVGAVGNPGILLNNREIPVSAFSFSIASTNATNTLNISNSGNGKGIAVLTSVDDALNVACLGGGAALLGISVNGIGAVIQSDNNTGIHSIINPASTNTVATSPVLQLSRLTSGGGGADGIGGSLDFFNASSAGNGRLCSQVISKWVVANDATRSGQLIFTVTNNAATPQQVASFDVFNSLYKIGNITGAGNGTILTIDDTANRQATIAAVNGLKITGDTVLIHTGTALANGAGAGAGTITNAPAAGNPTKWIKIDDNGTTRHVPAW